MLDDYTRMDRFDFIVPGMGILWALLGTATYKFQASDWYARHVWPNMPWPRHRTPFPRPARIIHISTIVLGSGFLILSPLFRTR